jgi:hypothetical protein
MPDDKKLPSDLSCNKGIITDISNNKYTYDNSCSSYDKRSLNIDKINKSLTCNDSSKDKCNIPIGAKYFGGIYCIDNKLQNSLGNTFTIDTNCKDSDFFKNGVFPDYSKNKATCTDPNPIQVVFKK